MKRKTLAIGGAGLATLVAAGAIAGVAIGTGGGDDSERPITGPALEQASDAALAHVGEGRVTDTEVGDEESLYEVEITLPNGSEIDVQLDEGFNVVGSEADRDEPGDTDADDAGRP